MSDFNAVAQQFVEYYYKSFDEDRSGLAPLYRDNSMLTFEGAPCQGVNQIIEKLQGLPFAKVRHQVSTLDAQPGHNPGSVLVVVSGVLLVEAEERPMSYVQSFTLNPEGGSFFVFNDVFRLVYPAS